MELVQCNEVAIVSELRINIFVSPYKFLNDDSMSPLSLACETGNIEMTELVIENGEKINPSTKSQVPPLHAAIRGGHYDLVC